MRRSSWRSRRGRAVLKRPEKVFWGGYSGYFADPDGHVWELAMNPGWPLSAGRDADAAGSDDGPDG